LAHSGSRDDTSDLHLLIDRKLAIPEFFGFYFFELGQRLAGGVVDFGEHALRYVWGFGVNDIIRIAEAITVRASLQHILILKILI